MENTVMNLFMHPTVLTAVFVGAGVLILMYILKLIRKDEDIVVQKPKNEIPSHTEKRKDTAHGGKTKKKTTDNRWTARNEKQTFTHPWLLTTLKGHTGSILDLDFSSSGKYLTSCGDEDPDPGGLASGESSSSSSECQKENSRSPSAEPTPRTKKGLSRRQRKNRRREPSSTTSEKQKKTRSKKLSSSSSSSDCDTKKSVMDEISRKQFAKFKATASCFEKLLRRYVLTPDQLMLHGYPVDTADGCVMIYKSPKFSTRTPRRKRTNFDVNAREFVPKNDSNDSGQGSSSSSDSGESADSEESPPVSNSPKCYSWTSDKYIERTCVRCEVLFYTTHEGYAASDECCYHWGRLHTQYNGLKLYTCCQKREGAPGCTKAPLHVWNGVVCGANGPFHDFSCTQPLTRTNPRGRFGVYALDCEMCYTVNGLECTKVSLVDMRGRNVYDAFVLPESDIVDYNTRFSGITARDIEQRAIPLAQVQQHLQNIISKDTVLIGHGLENDLRALKLVHRTVVDTAVAFPHYHGLPYRRSLRNLASSVLHRTIQDSESGHDSYEDACTCMELMLWKVRKDFRQYLDDHLPTNYVI